MPNCLHCQRSLSEVASRTKTCPYCGQLWQQASSVDTASPAKPATVANFQTIDLTASTPTPAAPNKPATVANFPDHTIDLSGDQAGPTPSTENPLKARNDATVRSGDLAAIKEGFSINASLQDKPGTLPDRGQATLDTDASVGHFDRQIDRHWDKSETPSSPYVTMRSMSQQAAENMPENSSLVIRERALAGMSDRSLHVADYDLLEVLGEGGMGVVYTARQASVDREVAVKMLKPEMLASSAQRRKFLSEAVVTGELDHPNIVPIYDVGQNADGALFYSMKKVQGTPWSKVIRDKTLAENLDILLKVADAVAFAHDRGVIHRDLKPENAMLGDYGEVLVLDWGLAVATEGHRPTPNVATEFGIAGTPAYMSPELAMGPLEQIGKHSDVYLLGAILFEIITGFPPHQGKHAFDCLKAAARNELAPTEKRGELFDIALRAMRTDPGERYANVQAFQEAIRGYQSHSQSIALSERAELDLKTAAKSDNYRDYARALLAFEEAYSLWNGNEIALAGISCTKVAYADCAHRKHDYDLGLSLLDEGNPDHAEIRGILLASKHERDARQGRLKAARRVVAGLIAAFCIAVTAGIVLTTAMKVEADKQRDLAQQQKKEADTQRDIADDQRRVADDQRRVAGEQRDEARRQQGLAIEARRQAEYEAYVALISMAAAKIDEHAFGQATQALAACQKDLRGWEWARLNYTIQQGVGRQLPGAARVEAIAADALGTRLAVGDRDGVVRLWNLQGDQSAREVYRLAEPQAVVHALAFSPSDANLLAIGTNVPGQQLLLLHLQTGEVRPLAGEQGHREAVVHLTFSRDGNRLLTASHDYTAKLWDIATGTPLTTYRGHSWLVWSAIFSPDENESYVATASEDGTVRLWDTTTGKEWKSAKGEPVPFTAHQGPVYAVAFLPHHEHTHPNPSGDGNLPNIGYLASAGYDKRILLWQPHELTAFDYKKLLAEEQVPQTPFIEFTGHTAAVRDIAFSSDGSRLLSASNDNSLRLWYARDQDLGFATVRRGSLEKELLGHDGPVQTALFLPGQANEIASAGFDRTVRLWNSRQYRQEQALPVLALRGHVDAVMAATFARDGQSVFTASRDRTAKKWSAADDGRELLTFREGHAYLTSKASFFPQGERLLTAAVDGTVRVWNVHTGAELLKIEGTGYRSAAALSPDGQWILTGSEQEVAVSTPGDIQSRREGAILWSAQTGERAKVFSGHKVPVTAVAFSHDGAYAYTGDEHGVGQLWNVASGQSLAKLEFHLGPITAAAFTNDAKRLLTASADKSVAQWNISDPTNVVPLQTVTLKHSAAVNALALAPDDQRVLTGCDDGTARLWELETGREIWLSNGAARSLNNGAQQNSAASINSVAISPQVGDEVGLIVDSGNQVVSLLDLATGREILAPVGNGALDHFLNLRVRDALGWSAAFSPDGKQVITVGGDEARLWDRQGVEVAVFGPHRPLTFVDVSPNDRIIVTAGWDHSARLWDATTGAALLTLDHHTAGEQGGHTRVVNSAVFSPNGEQILTASDDGTLRLWNVASGRVERVLRPNLGGVTRARFLRSGQAFAAGFRGDMQGATAGIWSLVADADDADLGAPQVALIGHSLTVLDLAISDDEQFIVTGSADNSARIWNTTSGQQLVSLNGHSGEVNAVAFSRGAEHRRVLTGSADRTAKLWDVSMVDAPGDDDTGAQAKELLTLRGHTRSVTSASFSPDGATVLTASRDGLAILWPTDSNTAQDQQVSHRGSEKPSR